MRTSTLDLFRLVIPGSALLVLFTSFAFVQILIEFLLFIIVILRPGTLSLLKRTLISLILQLPLQRLLPKPQMRLIIILLLPTIIKILIQTIRKLKSLPITNNGQISQLLMHRFLEHILFFVLVYELLC